MHVPFRPAPLETLARWIFGALDAGGPVLGIPRESFAVPGPRLASRMLGTELAAPIGLAAGPHTQLAQNLVAGWLCGARFFELKTVQVLDRIEVPRPCIDAADEAYNVEWSQELTLEQSFAEYLHAWVLIHALAARLGLPGPGSRFAISVGYDLAGIRSEGVSRFLSSMRDARAALPAAIEAVARAWPGARDVPIPRQLSDHVTLSTMHGCPPAEIERIARHLLGDLGFHTWVKLNPTLLGPERVRGLLNRTLGWDVEVPDAAFAHDPVFADAAAMCARLGQAAEVGGRAFGVKLSNTLEVVNRRPDFPGEKTAYLSGRALHPLTLALAQRLDEALGGGIPISFCGGADAWNVAGLVEAGLGPVTVCTDLLKPGGYGRLKQYLENLESALDRAGAASLAAYARGGQALIAREAGRAASDARSAARERPLRFKGARALGPFDCAAAPCQEACPAHQDVPAYLRAVAAGRPSEALEIALRTNPLPGVTGSACDRPCTERCVRTLIDAPLAIREVKRFAAEQGRAPAPAPLRARGVKVAIVGAGPAGLGAAALLAELGFPVEVFEARAEPGGMVGGVIPPYRMDRRALEGDLARLRALGVAFHLGRALGRELPLARLRDGFAAVFVGVGAQQGKRLGVPGDGAEGVIDALDLLGRVREGRPPALGRRVLVVGGGNSAMDAARTARRLAPEAEVTLVYRRTRAQMPADPAELRDCAVERIGLRELLAPLRVEAIDGRAAALICAPMALVAPEPGARDPRPRPVAAPGREVRLEADAIVAAIGQELGAGFDAGLELRRTRSGAIWIDEQTGETSAPGIFAGGDAARGPSSIIQAVADGRRAALAIARRHGVEPQPDRAQQAGLDPASHDRLLARRGERVAPQTVPHLPPEARSGFAEVIGALPPGAAAAEASRCLDCDRLCSLCVTVCPNRAMLDFPSPELRLELPRLVLRGGRLAAEGAAAFTAAQPQQIVCLADFCNQCGNCVASCPTAGAPWRDKPRFWLDREGFAGDRGDAHRIEAVEGGVAVEARLGGRLHRLERRGAVAEYRSDTVLARFLAEPWRLVEWAPAAGAPALAEGQAIDLSPCAALLVLSGAARVLPVGG